MKIMPVVKCQFTHGQWVESSRSVVSRGLPTMCVDAPSAIAILKMTAVAMVIYQILKYNNAQVIEI